METSRVVGVHRAPVPGQSSEVRAVVSEAFAYVGGAIVAAASMLLASLVWDDVGTGGELVILTSAAVALLIAGLLTPAAHGEPTGRLRAALWLAAVAVGAAALAVAADGLGLGAAPTALFVSGPGTALTVLLWRQWPSPAQQVATFVLAAIAARAAADCLGVPDRATGLGVWGVGVLWVCLGHYGVTRPRALGVVAGAAMAVLGAMMTSDSDAGTAFTLVTLAALAAAAVRLQSAWLAGVAAVGLVVNVPVAAARWFPGSVSVPLVLLAVGAAIVGLSVRGSRRRPRITSEAGPAPTRPGTRSSPGRNPPPRS